MIRVVALLTVRNEAVYLPRCISHLHEQGIEACVIDNDSTDGSRQIAEQFIDRGVCQIERLPYEGYFDLLAQCRHQAELAKTINADWFMHLDADEIPRAPNNMTLKSGLQQVADLGYVAVNFDEFVFMPTDENETFEGRDYVAEMEYYYFFEPYPLRLIRAWKKSESASYLEQTGGHRAVALGSAIYPENFILQHYMALSAAHARRKYSVERRYSSDEVQRLGWHGPRSSFDPNFLVLPQRDRLQKRQPLSPLNKECPWRVHGLFESQPS